MYIADLDPDVLRLLTNARSSTIRVHGVRPARAQRLCDRGGRRAIGRGRYSGAPGRGASTFLRTSRWGASSSTSTSRRSDGKRRRVAVVGRAGTTIVDDLGELDAVRRRSMVSDQVSGQIVSEALQQSAGRRAVLRDPRPFPRPSTRCGPSRVALAPAIEPRHEEVDTQTADRLADTVRKSSSYCQQLADLTTRCAPRWVTSPGPVDPRAPRGPTERQPDTTTVETEPARAIRAVGGRARAVSADLFSRVPEHGAAAPDRRRSAALPSVEPILSPAKVAAGSTQMRRRALQQRQRLPGRQGSTEGAARLPRDAVARVRAVDNPRPALTTSPKNSSVCSCECAATHRAAARSQSDRSACRRCRRSIATRSRP